MDYTSMGQIQCIFTIIWKSDIVIPEREKCILEKKSVPYRADTVVVIPRNYPHRTQGIRGQIQKWEYLYVDSEKFLKEQFAREGYVCR